MIRSTASCLGSCCGFFRQKSSFGKTALLQRAKNIKNKFFNEIKKRNLCFCPFRVCCYEHLNFHVRLRLSFSGFHPTSQIKSATHINRSASSPQNKAFEKKSSGKKSHMREKKWLLLNEIAFTTQLFLYVLKGCYLSFCLLHIEYTSVV